MTMTGDIETPTARAIRERLEALGMTEPELMRRAPVDAKTLASVRAGSQRTYRRTTEKLERVLDWPDGTLRRLLDGDIEPEAVATVRREVVVNQTSDSPGDRVTLQLDVPLDVWQGMSELQRSEAMHVASAAILRRLQEMQQEAERPRGKGNEDDKDLER
jgi:transcriptional regulator with XRE-family HTH domain